MLSSAGTSGKGAYIAVCLPRLRHLAFRRASSLATATPTRAPLAGSGAARQVGEQWEQPFEPPQLPRAAPRDNRRKHARSAESPTLEDQREGEHAAPRDDQLEARVVAAEEEAVRRHPRELETPGTRFLAANEPGGQLVREDLRAAGEIGLDRTPEPHAPRSADD